MTYCLSKNLDNWYWWSRSGSIGNRRGSCGIRRGKLDLICHFLFMVGCKLYWVKRRFWKTMTIYGIDSCGDNPDWIFAFVITSAHTTDGSSTKSDFCKRSVLMLIFSLPKSTNFHSHAFLTRPNTHLLFISICLFVSIIEHCNIHWSALFSKTYELLGVEIIRSFKTWAKRNVFSFGNANL